MIWQQKLIKTMFIANKITSTIKPNKFESLNNGIWYYNYDIEENEVETLSMTTMQLEKETRYSFIQVRISGKPTFSKCFEQILKEYKDKNKTTLYDHLLTEGANDQINDINYNIKVDFNLAVAKSDLDKAKELVLREITEYDTSSNVNSFIINNIEGWFDKNTRVGLMNSITIEKNSGKENTTLWVNGNDITIKCTDALNILSELELYALKCYNTTANHKEAVNNLTTIEEVQNYDYTTNYPDKLVIRC